MKYQFWKTWLKLIIINIFIIINVTSDAIVTFPVITVIKFWFSR